MRTARIAFSGSESERAVHSLDMRGDFLDRPVEVLKPARVEQVPRADVCHEIDDARERSARFIVPREAEAEREEVTHRLILLRSDQLEHVVPAVQEDDGSDRDGRAVSSSVGVESEMKTVVTGLEPLGKRDLELLRNVAPDAQHGWPGDDRRLRGQPEAGQIPGKEPVPQARETCCKRRLAE